MIDVRGTLRLAVALVVAGLAFASASLLVPGIALAVLAGSAFGLGRGRRGRGAR